MCEKTDLLSSAIHIAYQEWIRREQELRAILNGKLSHEPCHILPTEPEQYSLESHVNEPFVLSSQTLAKPGLIRVSRPQLPLAASRNNSSNCDSPVEERKFICALCDTSFSYKHVLQNHMRTHTGEKPFTCDVCNKQFTRDHHLKTHMRLHTGEKPYPCRYCSKRFVQVANMRRHLKVHEMPTTTNMSGCQRAYSFTENQTAALPFDYVLPFARVQEEPEDLSLKNRCRNS